MNGYKGTRGHQEESEELAKNKNERLCEGRTEGGFCPSALIKQKQ
jgi:hypothetical protein